MGRDLIAFLFIFLIPAFTVHAEPVSVDFRNVTVERALEILKNSHGYSFVFKTEDVDLKARVDARFRSADIETVLAKVFENQPVDFQVNDKMVHIIKRSASQGNAAQSASGSSAVRTVKGKVTDRNGEPLVGVGIVIKGTTKGASTDIDGNYSISANDGDVLQFMCLGFDNVEISLGKSDNIDVSMSDSVNSLDESIIIGYGTVKKSDLTGAVASVKADELPVSSNTSHTCFQAVQPV